MLFLTYLPAFSTDRINKLTCPLLSSGIWPVEGTGSSRGEKSCGICSSWEGHILLPRVSSKLLSFLDFSFTSNNCSFSFPLQAWRYPCPHPQPYCHCCQPHSRTWALTGFPEPCPHLGHYFFDYTVFQSPISRIMCLVIILTDTQNKEISYIVT